MDEREMGSNAHVKQTTRTTTYQRPDPNQEQPTRPTYEQRSPHPAHGLDRDAARRRVEQNPAVMPTNPKPYEGGRAWMNKEFFGMRALPLALVLGGGVLLPFLLRMMGGRRETEERGEAYEGKRAQRFREAYEGKRAQRFREFFEDNQSPRFIAFTSKPYGKGGKKSRGLFMAKLGPAKGE